MKNIVFYTSIVDKYDKLIEPDEVMADCDYICFSNDFTPPKNSIWQLYPIPFQSKNKVTLSRFAKLNPHKILEKYQYSLWVDGNVGLRGNYAYSRILELIDKGVLVSMPKHPFRDCTYDEARLCIRIGKEKKNIIHKQIEKLKSENFPENLGLFEGNIIFRNHMHKKIVEFDEAWWEEFQNYSKRDQLSLRYVLWKNEITCVPFFEEEYNVRNHSGFFYQKHKRRLSHKINKRIHIIGNKL